METEQDGVLVRRELVVVGASTGGVDALEVLILGLAPDLRAAVLVVLHLPVDHETQLAAVLGRRARVPVRVAEDGDPLLHGVVLVAPPGRHLEVVGGAVRLRPGPRENGFRPAIDPLFRSAARAHGAGVVAVLLSGALLDGVSGLMAVRGAGGAAVVQDPQDAVFPDLPRHAIELAGADHVAAAAELPALIAQLVDTAVPARAPEPPDALADRIVRDLADQERRPRAARQTTLTCPDCGGTLWQAAGGVGFRCHLGHAYEIDRLQDAKGEILEAALWTAVRNFRERATLSRQMADQAEARGEGDRSSRHRDQAEIADRNAAVIVEQLLS